MSRPPKRKSFPRTKPLVSEASTSGRIRLNRFLASTGLGSRRACDGLIAEGRIEVNGERVTQLGVTVDPGSDVVKCDGERRRAPTQRIYLLLNKPSGVITTRSDEEGRATVEDYLGRHCGRVVPVGRLDRATEGLLLFTNYGDLVNRLLHPRYQQPRTYLAWIQPPPSAEDLRAIEAGVMIGLGEVSGPAETKVMGRRGGTTRVRITLREGRNREVRRIFRSRGLRVTALRRTDYAGIVLGELPVGAIRPLTPKEIELLAEATGLTL